MFYIIIKWNKSYDGESSEVKSPQRVGGWCEPKVSMPL